MLEKKISRTGEIRTKEEVDYPKILLLQLREIDKIGSRAPGNWSDKKKINEEYRNAVASLELDMAWALDTEYKKDIEEILKERASISVWNEGFHSNIDKHKGALIRLLDRKNLLLKKRTSLSSGSMSLEEPSEEFEVEF
jgi:hypothetical protein